MKFPWGNFTDVMGICSSTFFFGTCAVMGTCSSTFFLGTCAVMGTCFSTFLDQKTTLWQDLLIQAKSRTEEDLLTQAKSRGPTSRVNCFLPMAECAHRVTKNSN